MVLFKKKANKTLRGDNKLLLEIRKYPEINPIKKRTERIKRPIKLNVTLLLPD